MAASSSSSGTGYQEFTVMKVALGRGVEPDIHQVYLSKEDWDVDKRIVSLVNNGKHVYFSAVAADIPRGYIAMGQAIRNTFKLSYSHKDKVKVHWHQSDKRFMPKLNQVTLTVSKITRDTGLLPTEELQSALDGKVISPGFPFSIKPHQGGVCFGTVTATSTLSPRRMRDCYGLFEFGKTKVKWLRPTAPEHRASSSSAAASRPPYSSFDDIEPYFHDPISDLPLNLSDYGVGGMKEQVFEVIRRGLLFRLLGDQMQQYGVKPGKGILLYGPPGTGKTTIARALAKVLPNAKVKMINGPELLDAYVGRSEENIRKLFEDAEADYKRYKERSPLHILIFDEIDAICRQRGGGGSTGTRVSDNMVNQLLTKIDGLAQFNNILVIGMTNRKDLLDPALTRPGRIDVHVEISLPDRTGRREILDIHTKTLKKNGLLDVLVDLDEWARRTVNFTGADIEALVREAVNSVMPTNFDEGEGNTLKRRGDLATKGLSKVKSKDFEAAYRKVSPSYGISQQKLEPYLKAPFIVYPSLKPIYEEVNSTVEKFFSGGILNKFSVLLTGECGTGKTTCAVQIANQSKAPFVEILNAADLTGESDRNRIDIIESVYQKALKSKKSVLILDDIPGMISFVPRMPYSAQTYIYLRDLINRPMDKEDHKLLIIGTAESRDVMKELQLESRFSQVHEVPVVAEENMFMVLHEMGVEEKELETLGFIKRPYPLRRLKEVASRAKLQ